MADRTSQMERLMGYYVGYFAIYLIRLAVDSGLFSARASPTLLRAPAKQGRDGDLTGSIVHHHPDGSVKLGSAGSETS
jgi:hypothetical protein